MVMTTSEAWTDPGVRIFGAWWEMSMPTSAIASTAAGLIESAGAEPAERTSMRSPAISRSHPAAIWERPALWTQTNRTLGRAVTRISKAGSRESGDIEEGAEFGEGRRNDGVVGPATLLLAREQAGVDALLHVVADGRLADPERLGEVARTD